MRASFVMYKDCGPLIEALSDEQAGILIKAIYDYQDGVLNPPQEPMTRGIFQMMCNRFDVDIEKYEAICERNRKNGSKGGRPKTQSVILGTQKNQKNPDGYFGNPNDNDNDNDNDIKKENVKRKSSPPAKKEFGEHHKVRLTDDQYQKLITEFGEVQTKRAIEFLDSYIVDKGYKSKDNYLAIRRWVFDALREQDEKRKPKPSNTFNQFQQNNYDFGELESKLLDN